MGHNGARRVYLDHAATTPVREEVVAAMRPHWREVFGNPSSVYQEGREALHALDEAREQVAAVLGAHPREIIFTSGGSESDNLALRGVALAAGQAGGHLVVSAVEHHAVLHTAMDLARGFGFELTILPVDGFGRVDPASLESSLRADTVLVSVMLANNEVGSLQPVEELAAIARQRGVPFHTDAVQAAGQLPLRVEDLGVDLLSLSGHKFHGPRGTGVLYARRGVRIQPMISGGGQEQERRAGTENVAGAVGLATALVLAERERPEVAARLQPLRDRLLQEIPALIEAASVTGHPTERLPGSASFLLEEVEGEGLLLGLDLAGIAASTGSACTTGSTEPSHVLRAMGLAGREARGSLRLTLGRETTEEDVERVLEVLPGLVTRLRRLGSFTAARR